MKDLKDKIHSSIATGLGIVSATLAIFTPTQSVLASCMPSSDGGSMYCSYYFSPPWVEEQLAKYPMFSAQWYLQQNSDVNNACRGNLECARQHYLANGLNECRNASRFFNPRWYLENNPDVKSVFKDCRGASEHWSGAGRRERRPGAPGVSAP